MVVAEELGRFETIGIDLIAMNVNDLICVGAEPIALLDFILCREATPEICGQIGEGLRAGAEQAGHRDPRRRDRAGRRRRPGLGARRLGDRPGRPRLDRHRRAHRARRRPDRPPLLRAPLERLHARPQGPGRRAAGTTNALAGLSATSCSSRPTIYVRAVLELLASGADVRGLAHITGDGLNNLLRLSRDVGYELVGPARRAAGLRPDPGARRDLGRGDARGLQHGPRLRLRSSRKRTPTPRPSCWHGHHPGTRAIGVATDRAGDVGRA